MERQPRSNVTNVFRLIIVGVLVTPAAYWLGGRYGPREPVQVEAVSKQTGQVITGRLESC